VLSSQLHRREFAAPVRGDGEILEDHVVGFDRDADGFFVLKDNRAGGGVADEVNRTVDGEAAT